MKPLNLSVSYLVIIDKLSRDFKFKDRRVRLRKGYLRVLAPSYFKAYFNVILTKGIYFLKKKVWINKSIKC